MLLPLPIKQFKTGRVVTDWNAIGDGSTFQVNPSQEIEVVSNKQVEKVSKTGNKRKERRLTIKLKGFKEMVEVGTESFKKLSFMKRLVKMSKTQEHVKYELIPVDEVRMTNLFGEFEDHFYNRMEREILRAETMKEIKAVYKKWAKIVHPDSGNGFHVNEFRLLKELFEMCKTKRMLIIETLREAGLDVEY